MVRNSNLKGSVLNSTSDKIVSHEKKHNTIYAGTDLLCKPKPAGVGSRAAEPL